MPSTSATQSPSFAAATSVIQLSIIIGGIPPSHKNIRARVGSHVAGANSMKRKAEFPYESIRTRKSCTSTERYQGGRASSCMLWMYNRSVVFPFCMELALRRPFKTVSDEYILRSMLGCCTTSLSCHLRPVTLRVGVVAYFLYGLSYRRNSLSTSLLPLRTHLQSSAP